MVDINQGLQGEQEIWREHFDIVHDAPDIIAARVNVVGVRLAVPFWFGRGTKMKRVRQALPLQPGRQSRWQLSKVRRYATQGNKKAWKGFQPLTH
jgi:hypothetical protein